jgi:hypothetical protein
MKNQKVKSKVMAVICVIAFFSSSIAQETKPIVKETLIRNLFEETPFVQFGSGAQVYYLFGGMNKGVPSSQIGVIDPGVTFPLHAHTNGYYAVIVSGNSQHWEEGSSDKGPIMISGDSYYQAGGVPHYDSCIGPEKCILVVTFAESMDVIPIEKKEVKKKQ